MATIKDVAKEAGVSVATVSRVLNHSDRASKNAKVAVNCAMKKLGYRPNANARALVSQSTNTIGVLIGDVSDPFFGGMVKTIDQIALQHGKHLLIGNGYYNEQIERDAIDLLMNSRCDSLILHSKALSNQELIDIANEVPSMVLINRYIEEIAQRCIALDNRKGSYLATEYLIKQGHRHIGYICSSNDIEDSHQRKAGYLDALQANGIEPQESYIEFGTPNERGGEKAMTMLLTKGLPITAVATYNDYMAAGALSILDENGMSVPDDISVIGFDDGLIAKYLNPKLTTIRYPIEMMAAQAANLALRLARHEASPGDSVQMFSPTLVRRYSVANRS